MTDAMTGPVRDQLHQAPLLELCALEKTFVTGWLRNRKTVRAVAGVDLALRPGQAIGLVGESGSGKSTVARLIARLVRPTSGQILLNGADVLAAGRRHTSRAYRHDVQMIFQDPFSSLNPVHTIGYHLTRSVHIHGTAGGRPAAEAVADLLEDVGLGSVAGITGRYPHELSGGQRQRVAIARTLAARPSVLSPTSRRRCWTCRSGSASSTCSTICGKSATSDSCSSPTISPARATRRATRWSCTRDASWSPRPARRSSPARAIPIHSCSSAPSRGAARCTQSRPPESGATRARRRKPGPAARSRPGAHRGCRCATPHARSGPAGARALGPLPPLRAWRRHAGHRGLDEAGGSLGAASHQATAVRGQHLEFHRPQAERL